MKKFKWHKKFPCTPSYAMIKRELPEYLANRYWGVLYRHLQYNSGAGELQMFRVREFEHIYIYRSYGRYVVCEMFEYEQL